MLITFNAPAGVNEVSLPDGSAVKVINGQFQADAQFTNALETAQCYPVNAAIKGGAYYAAQNGVSGINDGSRDDTPLLQAAYAAAIAGGFKSLVLPLGEVYLSSYTLDTANSNYPGSYVVRVDADDFTVIVPAGCRINCSGITGSTDSAAQNHIDIFQFTGNRSGIKGGGKFYHSAGGYTSTTPNNCIHAVHLTAGSDACFEEDLYADGLCGPAYGVFDNSSSNRGFQRNLRVNNCGIGVNQSSAQNTTSGQMIDIQVVGALKIGAAITGNRIEVANIAVDSSAVTALANWLGFNMNGRGDLNQMVNIKIRGPNKSSAVGIQLATNFTTGGILGRSTVSDIQIENCWTGIVFAGVQNLHSVKSGQIYNCLNGMDKQALSGRNCGDVIVSDFTIDNVGDPFRINGGAQTDLTQGKYILDKVTCTNFTPTIANSIVASSVAVVKSAINCVPMPINGRPALGATDKGTLFYDAALTNPRFITFSGTGTTWYDGAGTSV